MQVFPREKGDVGKKVCSIKKKKKSFFLPTSIFWQKHLWNFALISEFNVYM